MTGGLLSAAMAIAMCLQAPEISRGLQMRVGRASNTGGRVDWLAEEGRVSQPRRGVVVCERVGVSQPDQARDGRAVVSCS